MPKYSQSGRPIRVDTVLGPDVLLLAGFTGTEAVSRPFAFQLDLLSENASIDPASVLRTHATITVELRSGDARSIDGIVNRFIQLGAHGDLTHYRAEVVPWLWFLSLSRDCKIFQDKTVLEIIEAVFKTVPGSAFDLRCTRSYPKREYCVQYRETHLDFVSRLMEEEGIFYFFEHEDGKHTLVVVDANTGMKPCPGTSTARITPQPYISEDVITRLESVHSVHSGVVTLRDYDYLQPSLTLNSTISGQPPEEIYDYQPVVFTKLEEGERYARIQLEAEEARQQVIRGEGTCRFLQSGYTFDLEEHYRGDLNQTYALLEIEHTAVAGDYRTGQMDEFDYGNKFAAIPKKVPFRPAMATPRPAVRGAQTAVVVGKSGEEIWVDKHGRVKVQFHWDRDGKKDEKSSCWVRVSSAWAGKAWGAISIPRIGQEVLVDFIEGDPDRPIITGRVYNAEQTPPYTLPTNQTQSGVKSRSSKSGGTENFNELRFEDKKGEELIYFHAEKNKEVMVENDRKEEVKHDETITIGNDRTELVKNDEKITIEGNRTEEVKKDETITVKGKRTETVEGDETIQVKGDRAHTVDKGEKLKVGAKQDVSIGSDRSVKVSANDTLEVSSNLDVKANQNITIKAAGGKIKAEAATGIELKCGACTVKITPAGIELKAPQIKIQGMAQVELKAPMLMGKADALLQMKGAIAQVNGDGVLMVKGGITMIN